MQWLLVRNLIQIGDYVVGTLMKFLIINKGILGKRKSIDYTPIYYTL